MHHREIGEQALPFDRLTRVVAELLLHRKLGETRAMFLPNPVRHGLLVQRVGVGREPGRVLVHVPRAPCHPPEGRLHLLEQGLERERIRDLSTVEIDRHLEIERIEIRIQREQRKSQPELARQGQPQRMIVADQLAARLDHAARLVLAPDAAADALARFENRHVAAMRERVAGHQAAEPRSDDGDTRTWCRPRRAWHFAGRCGRRDDHCVGKRRADQLLTVEADELPAVAAIEPCVNRAHD